MDDRSNKQKLTTAARQFKTEEKYWREKLSGNLTPCAIPHGSPKPGSATERRSVAFNLEESVSDRLLKLSNQSDSRLFMVLVSVLVTMLYKHTGKNDIIVISPVLRQDRDSEFINTILVLRNRADNRQRFKELLLQVKDTILEANNHQNFPLVSLLHQLEGLDPGAAPLSMDVGILLENFHEKSYLDSLPCNMIFSFKHTGNHLKGTLEYNSRLYDKKTVEGITVRYGNLLDSALTGINEPIGRLNMLTDSEKEQLLHEFNDTAFQHEGEKLLLHQLFEEQAEKTPDSTGFVYVDRVRGGPSFTSASVSYREMNKRADRLAWGLLSRGVGASDVVAVAVTHSLDMIIAILGILKAGGAYLPIDPSYPENRIKFMLADCGAALFLHDGKTPFDSTVLNHFNLYREPVEPPRDGHRVRPGEPSQPAYIIYTSGSTGRPKGVVVGHKGAVNTLLCRKHTYQIDKKAVSLQLFSSAFDGFVTSFFTPIISGSQIIIMNDNIRKVTQCIHDVIIRNCVTHFISVPALFQAVIEMLSPGDASTLRLVTLAGDMISPKLPEISKQKNKNLEISVEYGVTEASVMSTIHRHQENHDTVKIGKPAWNTTTYIFNSLMELMPPGIPGELFIGGGGVARGYLNNPSLTDERFILNPFIPGERLYRTGDSVRWLPDGNLEFLGRLDHQVKIRGFRIEPGEIENQLIGHPQVKDSCVLAPQTDNNKKQLVGYIVPLDGFPREWRQQENLKQDMSNYLEDRLPGYMIPPVFVLMESFPLTPNGKIDRKLLPPPRLSRVYVPPRDDSETSLVAIWANILKITEDTIGIDDDFFEMGGHSLKVTTLIADIHLKFGVDIPMAEIFRMPTIRAQADYISKSGKEKLISIEPTEKREYYPVSSVQRRLFVLNRLKEEATHYNTPILVTLEGELEKKRMEESLGKVIKRHEILRTAFNIVNEAPVQIIHPEVVFNIDYFKTAALNWDKEAQKIIDEFIRPFDLSRAPLLRVGLVEIAADNNILMVDLHHIIMDGQSMGIFINDFMTVYNNRELPGLELQYKDFSQWQNRFLKTGKLNKQELYWKNQFKDEAAVLNLPTDYVRPPLQVFTGNSVDFHIDSRLTGRLIKLAQAENATLFMVLLAIFNVFLSKLSGQEDIVIGTPAAARRHPALEPIIGMFVNTLALRNTSAASNNFREFLQNVRDSTLEALDNQEYPFEDLLENIPFKRDPSHNPLFDVMFTLQNVDIPHLEIPGLKLKPYEYERGTSKFDLTWHAMELNDHIRFSLVYSTKLFKPGTIARFIDYLKNIIKSAAENPTEKLSGMEFIPTEEKRQILYDFNDTAAEYPEDKTIQRLFEEQVERTPDGISINFEDKNLTYKALDEHTGWLAGLCRQKGVKQDTIVGIMMERSIEMIIGILGILKAGGAYLPIDPDYPPKRIDHMLKDSSTRILLSSEVGEWDSRNDLEVIVLNESFWEISPISSPTPPLPHSPTQLCYIIYTSGSTGKPKGVMVEHCNAVNTVTWFAKKYGLGPGVNVLQMSDYTFDPSVNQVFGSLLSGARLHMTGKYLLADLPLLRWYIETHVIHILYFVPQMLKELLDQGDRLESVRAVLSGGERLDDTVKDTILQKGYRLFNQYGPTETTVDALVSECNSAVVTLGTPIANTRCYILDKHLAPVPVGVTGELLISGTGVARGYLNRPGLTAERFVDLNSPYESYRTYKTGDLARWLSDGNIEFIGRSDGQVKIRGYRVELGEIESQLRKHQKIKEAVVLARQKISQNLYLCAYFTHDGEVSTPDIRTHLSRTLPNYMIPSHFVRLEKMPVNSNGKIDRGALPEPDRLNPDSDRVYKAPRNEVEKKLAAIWEQVLELEKISIRDDFFLIGGDSIKSIQIVARMRKLGYKLEMKDIFQNSTIAAISPFVKKLERLSDQSAVTGVIPLTPVQTEFFNSGEIGRHHFNQSLMIYSAKGFDELAMKAIFSKIQEHHDALRLTFKQENGTIYQINRGLEFPLSFQVFDLQGEADAVKMLEEKSDDIQKSINLETGPLMKLGLFHMDDGDRLLIVFHHLVMDAVSWRIILEDINELYRQYKKGKKLELPNKSDSFKLWSQKLREYANSESFLKERVYWSKLESLNPPKIEKDFSFEEKYIKDASIASFIIGKEETNDLLTKANQAFGTEINDLLLAALGLAVSHSFGHQQVLVALESHGREDILEDIDITRTVGWFTNIYPVVFNPCWDDLSRHIKGTKETLHQVPDKGIGYWLLKHLTAKKHKQEINFKLAPQILFNYFGQFDSDIRQSSFKVENQSTGQAISLDRQRNCELEVSGIITDKQLTISAAYSKKQFKSETIESFMDHYKDSLLKVISHCLDQKERELTPSDLTYKELSGQNLDEIRMMIGSI